MNKIPTIRVKHKVYEIEMLINESDFDEKIHEKLDSKIKEVSKSQTKKQKEVDEELKALMGA